MLFILIGYPKNAVQYSVEEEDVRRGYGSFQVQEIIMKRLVNNINAEYVNQCETRQQCLDCTIINITRQVACVLKLKFVFPLYLGTH